MVSDIPERFGDYELVERLGVGGMAETFVALRRGPRGFEQRVCLKRILPVFANDPDFVEMFRREARLSALLHHPHIARVLDFGIVDQTHYLSLELIDGTDLRALLRHLRQSGESLGQGLAGYLAYALARALEFAHSVDENGRVKGIVHRDVSPSNVLLSHAGEVKLSDFGIAKATSQPGSVQSNALKGKIPYMAPEYALGRSFGARSDLFSLGVLLYECLAGFRPFDAENDMRTLERARNGDRQPLRQLAPDAPPELVDAIERLLAPRPEGRPAHAGELLDLLDQTPMPPLAPRVLGELVREVESQAGEPSLPGLASTRPGPTRRPRKHLRSRA